MSRGDGWTAVLRTPHSRTLLAATLVGRMPGCMCVVVLVLAVRADGGSYAWAGGLAAAWRTSFSVGQVAQGRLVDRYGQTRPIVAGAVVSSAAYAAAAVPGALAGPAGVVLVVIAGIASPPLEGGLRALWRHLVPVRQLPAAYSLDSAAMQAGHVLGPLAVIGCVAVGGPRAALAAMAVLGLAGAAVTAASPPSRAWQPQPSPGGMLAALRPPGLWLLLALFCAIGALIGTVDVIGPVLAERWHAAWLAGAVPAALPVGGIIGSAVYGWRPWPTPVRQQLTGVACLFVLGWLPLTSARGPVAAVVFVVVGGIAFGALLAICFQVVDVVAVSSMLRETYGWVLAAMGAGLAAGAALAGFYHGSLLLPLAAAETAALLAAAVSQHLVSAPASRTLVVRRGATTTDRAAERNNSSPRRDER